MRGGLAQPRIRVAVDVAAARMPRSGIGTYTRELVQGLARTGEVDLKLYINQARGPIAEALSELPGDLVRSRVPDRVLDASWRLINWPPIERLAGPMDLFHSSDWTHPPRRSVPVVTTIHDLGALRHPEWYHPSVVEIHRRKNALAVRSADAIIAISEFTRGDVLSLLPQVDPSRVYVVPNGVSVQFRPMEAHVARECARSLGLPPRFLLYVGSRERRKNILGLLEVFARIRAEEPSIDLVIVGLRPEIEGLMIHGVRAWSHHEVGERIARLGIQDHVHEVGQVPLNELIGIYGAAELMVYPTFYEGFGLPALEAMACGLPVVSSEGTAVEEVLGGTGRVAPPTDHDAFADAVLGLLRSPEEQLAHREAGLARAKTMSWDHTARGVLGVYRTVLMKREGSELA